MLWDAQIRIHLTVSGSLCASRGRGRPARLRFRESRGTHGLARQAVLPCEAARLPLRVSAMATRHGPVHLLAPRPARCPRINAPIGQGEGRRLDRLHHPDQQPVGFVTRNPHVPIRGFAPRPPRGNRENCVTYGDTGVGSGTDVTLGGQILWGSSGNINDFFDLVTLDSTRIVVLYHNDRLCLLWEGERSAAPGSRRRRTRPSASAGGRTG